MELCKTNKIICNDLKSIGEEVGETKQKLQKQKEEFTKILQQQHTQFKTQKL